MNIRVNELFHEVADMTLAARARYFAEHGVDDDTRGELEELLQFDSDSTTSLERDI